MNLCCDGKKEEFYCKDCFESTHRTCWPPLVADRDNRLRGFTQTHLCIWVFVAVTINYEFLHFAVGEVRRKKTLPLALHSSSHVLLDSSLTSSSFHCFLPDCYPARVVLTLRWKSLWRRASAKWRWRIVEDRRECVCSRLSIEYCLVLHTEHQTLILLAK